MKKILSLALCLWASACLIAQTQVKVGEDLQAAINAASSGTTVYVQAGTFTGNFTMKDGVNVSGGWDETFTTQTQYGTVLDGNANGRVVTQTADFTTLTTWENLTIQNGKLMSNGKGAGVYLLWKSLLKNCLIQNNTFDTDNVTECEGGGLAQDKDDNAGDIVADNCVIRNNEATHGGGVYLRSTMTNCIIENNKTLKSHPGGGAHLQWGRLYNCIIRGNHSSEDAGGIRAYGNCKIVNCLIADNTCDVKVAGLCCERTLDEVINTTIVNNNQAKSDTDKEYCGIRFDSDNAGSNLFVNNIVWGNKAGGVVQDQQVSYSICKYATASNNAIEGNVPSDYTTPYIKLASDNNAVDGPQFVDPANGDYSLKSSSPLVNKGMDVDDSKYVVKTALNGIAHVGLPEIGAYEVALTLVKVGDDLQAAINAASSGSTIYVQAGKFTGNFIMKEGVNVSGGWDETITTQTQYGTVLDANSSGRVVEQPGRFSTLTEWSNLTIQHGNGGDGAGALLCEGGRLFRCLITENEGVDGGAVCYDNGTMATVALEECIVSHNKGRRGAGMWCKATVINTVFEYNEASAGGGGVVTNPGRLINCIVRFNKATEDFGGVRACSGTYPDQSQVINCLIYGNEGREVGGLSIDDNMGDVIGNTIVCNNHHHGNPESGVNINRNYSSNKECIFANNVIWGNMKDGVVEAQQINDNVLCYENFFNNAIATKVPEGITAIILNADNAATDGPKFADPTNGDFSLVLGSPLVNRGLNAHATVEKDLAGKDRIVGPAVDLGAYELQQAVVTPGSDLQAAVDGAVAGDIIYVQEGTYKGNFTMKEGVNVSGGWDETFTTQKDYASILDAEQSGRVLKQPAGFATLTVWSNFTIQNGKDESGEGGGGVWLNRLGQVKHCLIQDNTTNNYGGGVAHNVTATSTHSEVVISDCWIRNNTSTRQGGGFRIGATIENSLIEGNTSGADGAGGYLQHGCAYGNIIRMNHSTGNAGALRAYGNTEIYNNLMYANVADGQLAGLSQGGANRTSNVVNNTIIANIQKSTTNPHRCGAMCGDNATKATFVNNIVWANMVGENINEKQTDIVASRMGTGVIANNAISGTAIGIDSILLSLDNPGFVSVDGDDASKWDLHLMFNSPLIEVGLNDAVVGTDVEGKERIAGQRVDLGAYELPWHKLTITIGDAEVKVGEQVVPAGEQDVPEGFTVAATITPDEGFKIEAVTYNGTAIEPADGLYTLPPVMEDATLVVETKKDTSDSLDETKIGTQVYKFIKNGNIYIRKGDKVYDLLGTEIR